MKKYMVADFIKENNQDIADRWNITLDELERYRDWETDRKSTRLNSSHRL